MLTGGTFMCISMMCPIDSISGPRVKVTVELVRPPSLLFLVSFVTILLALYGQIVKAHNSSSYFPVIMHPATLYYAVWDNFTCTNHSNRKLISTDRCGSRSRQSVWSYQSRTCTAAMLMRPHISKGPRCMNRHSSQNTLRGLLHDVLCLFHY